MPYRLAVVALALTASGCLDFDQYGVTAGDGGDLAMAVDLRSGRDGDARHDLSIPDDRTDAARPLDLQAPLDESIPPDLSAAADSSAIPDLTVSVDAVDLSVGLAVDGGAIDLSPIADGGAVDLGPIADGGANDALTPANDLSPSPDLAGVPCIPLAPLPPMPPVGAAPSTVITADFNGDGKPDLATLGSSGGGGGASVSVLLGAGGGFFHAPFNESVPMQSSALGAGDFDGDGKIDLVVAGPVSGLVLLIGNGDGTFKLGAPVAVQMNRAQSLVVGDWNGDGQPDLATIVAGGGSVTLVLSNGLPGVQRAFLKSVSTTVQAPLTTDALAAGDFNGDGKLDIAIASASGLAFVMLGDGAGALAARAPVAVGLNPVGIVAADLNLDGRVDIATSNRGSGTVSVLLGSGDGGLGAATSYASAVAPGPLLAVDLNHDLWIELVVLIPGSNSLVVLPNSKASNNLFPNALPFDCGGGPSALVAGDWNGDSKVDLAVADSAGVDVALLQGLGDTTFLTALRFGSAIVGINVVGILGGDWNNDGHLDLAIAQNDGLIGTYLNTQQVNLLALFNTFKLGLGLTSVITTDVNRDGILDLVGTSPAHGSVEVADGSVGGSFLAAIGNQLGGMPSFVVSGNFGVPNAPDFALVDSTAKSVELFESTFTVGATSTFAVAPLQIAAGDFNGDGMLDLAMASSGGAGVAIGKPQGAFQPVTSVLLSASLTAVAVADLNGDGRLDFAVTDGLEGTASVFLGNGLGQFAARRVFVVGQGPATIAAVDINGDGKVDLITGNAAGGSVTVLLGDGTGNFPARGYDFLVGGQPTSIAIGDWNGDQLLDVAAGSSGSPVATSSLLLNQGCH